MNFLHFAVFLFVFCSVVLVVASFATAPPSADQLAFLDEKPSSDDAPRSKWERQDLALSALLVAVVVALWIYFA